MDAASLIIISVFHFLFLLFFLTFSSLLEAPSMGWHHEQAIKMRTSKCAFKSVLLLELLESRNQLRRPNWRVSGHGNSPLGVHE